VNCEQATCCRVGKVGAEAPTLPCSSTSAGETRCEWNSGDKQRQRGGFGDGSNRGDGGRGAELLLPKQKIGSVGVAVEVGVAGVGCAEGGLPGRQVVSVDILIFVEVGRQERAVDHIDDEFADDGIGERVAGGELVGRGDAEPQVAGFDRRSERDDFRLIAERKVDFGGEREIAGVDERAAEGVGDEDVAGGERDVPDAESVDRVDVAEVEVDEAGERQGEGEVALPIVGEERLGEGLRSGREVFVEVGDSRRERFVEARLVDHVSQRRLGIERAEIGAEDGGGTEHCAGVKRGKLAGDECDDQ
jgi:hypothetical protein